MQILLGSNFYEEGQSVDEKKKCMNTENIKVNRKNTFKYAPGNWEKKKKKL